MATVRSLIDGFKAATTSFPLTAAVPGTPASPSFIGTDAITAPAGGFSAIYAFGDSLSDAGKVSIGTPGNLPVGGVYSDGRFTNGNVRLQGLAQKPGLPTVKPSLAGGTDFALADRRQAEPRFMPPTRPICPRTLANSSHPSPTALYTVRAGSNDVLEIANSTETPAQ